MNKPPTRRFRIGHKYKAKMTAKSNTVFLEVVILLYHFTSALLPSCTTALSLLILVSPCPLHTPCPGHTTHLALPCTTPLPFYTFEPFHLLLPLTRCPSLILGTTRSSLRDQMLLSVRRLFYTSRKRFLLPSMSFWGFVCVPLLQTLLHCVNMICLYSSAPLSSHF